MSDPLIVEDGTGVADANTWVSRAEFIAYAANQGFVLPDEPSTDVFIYKAMLYLCTRRYKGDEIQPLWERYFAEGLVEAPWPNDLPFPRINLFPGDCLVSLGRIIPNRLKKAECQIALDISNGFDPLPNIGANSGSTYLTMRKIGPLSEAFAYGDRDYPIMPIATGYLQPLLVGSGIFSLTVSKA